MKKWILTVSLLFVGGVCTLLAANFWETKKFTDWTEKERLKVLTDSPWASRVSIPRPPMGGDRGGRGGGMAFLPQEDGSGAGAFGSGGKGGGRGGGGGMMSVPEVELTLRWITALPVKQANALVRYGKEAGASPDAAKSLTRDEIYYIVQIEGYPGRLTKEAVSAGAQLVVKGVPPIQPLQTDVSPGAPTGRGAPPNNIFMVFPKTQPGAHLIKVEDAEVEVVVNVPDLKLKRKFKLKDMVFNGKLEM